MDCVEVGGNEGDVRAMVKEGEEEVGRVENKEDGGDGRFVPHSGH